MYGAELLGGPLHNKSYAVSYTRFVEELRFSAHTGVFHKPQNSTVVYKRFVANLYIYDRTEEHEDNGSDTHL